MDGDGTYFFLILNLGTRKKFLIDKEPLEEIMIEKAAELIDEHGEPYILETEEGFQCDAHWKKPHGQILDFCENRAQ